MCALLQRRCHVLQLSISEREAIGERTSDALAAMRANGQRISRHPPYGYRDNGSGWVPNEAEQRGVRLIVELRARGLSLRAIAAELEHQGIRSRGGRRLSPQVVSNVLKRQVI